MIYARFLAGHSEAEIARAVGVTPQRIHQIIKQELKNAAQHHQLLTEEALNVYVARLETLLKATWPQVIQGDLKAIETGRRLLEQQERLYGLNDQRAGKPPLMGEFVDEENLADVDDLTRYRMQRRRRPDEEAQ